MNGLIGKFELLYTMLKQLGLLCHRYWIVLPVIVAMALCIDPSPSATWNPDSGVLVAFAILSIVALVV